MCRCARNSRSLRSNGWRPPAQNVDVHTGLLGRVTNVAAPVGATVIRFGSPVDGLFGLRRIGQRELVAERPREPPSTPVVNRGFFAYSAAADPAPTTGRPLLTLNDIAALASLDDAAFAHAALGAIPEVPASAVAQISQELRRDRPV